MPTSCAQIKANAAARAIAANVSDPARTPAAVPYGVDLSITSAYWFTSSTSFADPAAAIARSGLGISMHERPLGLAYNLRRGSGGDRRLDCFSPKLRNVRFDA
jgi:hypothetical protein